MLDTELIAQVGVVQEDVFYMISSRPGWFLGPPILQTFHRLLVAVIAIFYPNKAHVLAAPTL